MTWVCQYRPTGVAAAFTAAVSSPCRAVSGRTGTSFVPVPAGVPPVRPMARAAAVAAAASTVSPPHRRRRVRLRAGGAPAARRRMPSATTSADGGASSRKLRIMRISSMALLPESGADLPAGPVEPRADRAVRDAERLGDLVMGQVAQRVQQQDVPVAP